MKRRSGGDRREEESLSVERQRQWDACAWQREGDSKVRARSALHPALIVYLCPANWTFPHAGGGGGGSVCCRDTETHSLVMNPTSSQMPEIWHDHLLCLGSNEPAMGFWGKNEPCVPNDKNPYTWSLRLMLPRDTGTNQDSMLKTVSQLIILKYATFY